jgi:hypothetical protein
VERTVANGQPAVMACLHGEAFGIAVLNTRHDGIAGITVFGDGARLPAHTVAVQDPYGTPRPLSHGCGRPQPFRPGARSGRHAFVSVGTELTLAFSEERA